MTRNAGKPRKTETAPNRIRRLRAGSGGAAAQDEGSREETRPDEGIPGGAERVGVVVGKTRVKEVAERFKVNSRQA